MQVSVLLTTSAEGTAVQAIKGLSWHPGPPRHCRTNGKNPMWLYTHLPRPGEKPSRKTSAQRAVSKGSVAAKP